MALVISDRIKEITNTVGTQTYQLEGAVTGFETFAANLSDGDTTYYAVTDNTNFEVGLGTINEGTSQTINYTVTVANVGGINVFVLNGVNNPVITFVKGFTYVFDVSDNTNGAHPLRFRTSADASYTDGVSVSGTQGQAGATVTIVVASDAPSTLKYYCTIHGNAMGNTINVISAVATLARTNILASSNSNNAVSFGTGAKTIFCTLPADKAVIKDASGNVGIGTSPQVPLDVNGQIRSKNGSVDLRLLPIDASNAGIIGTYSNDALVINTNSAERIRIDTSGNVGIGTTTPSAPLDVSGDAEITGTLTAGEVSATTLDIGGTNITATATEINKLDGVTATTTELNYVDVTTLGTVEASKAVTANSSGNITSAGKITSLRLRLTGSSDVSLSSTDHAFQIGSNSGVNIAMDGNEIVARNNGSASTLNLNTNGGTVKLGDQATAGLTLSGDIELGHDTDTTIARASAGVVTIEGNTILTTGNSDTPTTTTSSSDADFVLIDDGGTMKKITPSNLGITAGAASLDDATALAIALG